jgi:hypothetical protein
VIAFDQALAALRGERDQLTGRLGLVERAIATMEEVSGIVQAAHAATPSTTTSSPPTPGKSGWTCKACGQRGHTARSQDCPRKAPGSAQEPAKDKPAPAPPREAKRPAEGKPASLAIESRGALLLG